MMTKYKKCYKFLKKINTLDTWANFFILFGILLINLGFIHIGVLISLLANVLFLIFGLKTKYKGFVIVSCLMIFMNVYGTINWLFS